MLRFITGCLWGLLTTVSAGCGTSETAESTKRLDSLAKVGHSGSGSVSRPVPSAVPAKSTVILAGTLGERRVVVEVAKTAAQRSKGLMFREHLSEGTGMLFVFERETDQTFWMKNTLIPLDMIFIRRDFSIAGIVHEAEPQTLERRSVGEASLYVLEVPGGWTRSNGIETGQIVRFEGIEKL